MSSKSVQPFRRNTIYTHTDGHKKYIYIYKDKLLNGGWFCGLGAMIGETTMKFSGRRTMRVSAIAIFFEIYLKNSLKPKAGVNLLKSILI